jgi:hypothetical protein
MRGRRTPRRSRSDGRPGPTGLGTHLFDRVAEHVDRRIGAGRPRRHGVDTDPVGAEGRCQRSVKDSSAAFVAGYTGASAKLADAVIVETLTTAPDPRVILFVSSAAVRKNGARTSTSNTTPNESISRSSVGDELERGGIVHQHVDITDLIGEASHGLDVLHAKPLPRTVTFMVLFVSVEVIDV